MLGQKAAKYTRPPSEFIPGLVDEWTCYQFDNAVLWFVNTIENALTERVEVGAGDSRKSIARYTLTQLLDPAFTLPRDGNDSGMDMLMGGEYYDEVE